MAKNLFITATGTEVGKTHVVCQLIRQLRAQRRAVRAIKPVISGLRDGLEFSDTARVLRALGEEIELAQVNAISPFRFLEPISPNMAAKREHRSFDVQALLEHHRRSEEGLAQDDVLLVEGVGGAFVPLNDHELVCDWILALRIPVVLVCGSYLGTLSHTISTLRALQHCGIDVQTVVISESESSPVPLSETRETLRRFISIPIEVCPRNQENDLTMLVK